MEQRKIILCGLAIIMSSILMTVCLPTLWVVVLFAAFIAIISNWDKYEKVQYSTLSNALTFIYGFGILIFMGTITNAQMANIGRSFGAFLGFSTMTVIAVLTWTALRQMDKQRQAELKEAKK